MAKLISALRISGTIDGLMFCKQRKGGVTVQSKGGPSRFDVLFNKRFARTRHNAREYKRAIQAATLLRRGIGFLWRAASSQQLSGRMNKLLQQVLASDTESYTRCVHKGDVQLLEGFDYNQELSLDSALPVNLEYSMDAATGHARLLVPSHIVRHKRSFPKEATHFRIVSCLSALRFDEQRGRFQEVQSELLPLSQLMEAHEMEHHLVGQAGEVLVHTIGIVFFTMHGPDFRPIRGGALRIVQVARIEEKTFTLTPTDAKGKQLQRQRLSSPTPQPFTQEAPKKRRPRRRKKKQSTPLLLSMLTVLLLPVLLLMRRS